MDWNEANFRKNMGADGDIERAQNCTPNKGTVIRVNLGVSVAV